MVELSGSGERDGRGTLGGEEKSSVAKRIGEGGDVETAGFGRGVKAVCCRGRVVGGTGEFTTGGEEE